MGLIITPRYGSTRPGPGMSPMGRNPLANGLVFCHEFLDQSLICSNWANEVITNTGGATFGSGIGGPGWSTVKATSHFLLTANSVLPSGNVPRSVQVIWENTNASWSNNDILLLIAYSDSSTCLFQIYDYYWIFCDVWVRDVGWTPIVGVLQNTIATWDGGTANFFRNGTFVYTGSTSARSTGTGREVRFNSTPGGIQGFTGRFYSARIWNRCLSKTEAQFLTRNPYEIYTTPRRYWFGAAAAVGGTVPVFMNTYKHMRT